MIIWRNYVTGRGRHVEHRTTRMNEFLVWFSLFECGGCVGELALLRKPRKDLMINA